MDAQGDVIPVSNNNKKLNAIRLQNLSMQAIVKILQAQASKLLNFVSTFEFNWTTLYSISLRGTGGSGDKNGQPQPCTIP